MLMRRISEDVLFAMYVLTDPPSRMGMSDGLMRPLQIRLLRLALSVILDRLRPS